MLVVGTRGFCCHENAYLLVPPELGESRDGSGSCLKRLQPAGYLVDETFVGLGFGAACHAGFDPCFGKVACEISEGDAAQSLFRDILHLIRNRAPATEADEEIAFQQISTIGALRRRWTGLRDVVLRRPSISAML